MFGTLNGLMNPLLIYQQIIKPSKNTITIHNDYVKVYQVTIDATPSNYNSFFPERGGNNSLDSIFIDQDTLNGTRNVYKPHHVS